MMPFAAAIEPLRLANRLAGSKIYDWVVVGESGTGAGAGFDHDVVSEFAERLHGGRGGGDACLSRPF